MHPVRALFDHEAWANRELLGRCSEMAPALLARETPGTLGTIPRTMTHVVGTGQFLLALLTGQQSADPILAGHRDPQDPWGFASFDVDPGQPGGMTRMEVTFFRTSPSTTAAAVPVDRFVLQRPRSDNEDGQEDGEREWQAATVG
jgi:hypothetical protein